MKKIKFCSIISMVSLIAFSSCKNENKEEAIASNSSPKEITKVVGIAKVEPENGLLYIYSKGSGTIVSIPHKENEKVKQGTLLIGLDNKAELSQIAIEKSKITSFNSSVVYAEENLKTINTDLQKAKQDVLLNEKLFSAKAITEQSLNDSKAKVIKLNADYNKQIADINQVKSKRAEIDANINNKSVLLSDKNIKAPLDGKILQWDVHIGDYITAGQKLGQFAPEGALIAVTEVDELFADKVKLGMKAEIISQLDGQKIGEGEVVFMAEFLKKKSLFSDESVVEDRRVRTVKIRLAPDSKAIINARVDCIIKLK